MNTTVTIWNELMNVAHPMACDKGWWERDRAWPELEVLMHCEVSEAAEELRCGRCATWYQPDGKPEGMWVEIADMLIRLADACGKLDIKTEWKADRWASTGFKTVFEFLSWLHCELSDLGSIRSTMASPNVPCAVNIGIVVATCEMYARENNIDLYAVISEKLAYNATRPHRHGGKLA